MKLVVNLMLKIIGITVYMWTQNIIKSIFIYDNVLNIQYTIGKGLGYRERESSMVVNFYSGPIRTKKPHATTNCGPGKSKL